MDCIARDEPEAGLELLRSALESLHAQQYKLVILLFTGALAEGLRKTGQLAEALFAINGAIARAIRTVEWNLTCPNCFELNRKFSRRNTTENQP